MIIETSFSLMCRVFAIRKIVSFEDILDAFDLCETETECNLCQQFTQTLLNPDSAVVPEQDNQNNEDNNCLNMDLPAVSVPSPNLKQVIQSDANILLNMDTAAVSIANPEQDAQNIADTLCNTKSVSISDLTTDQNTEFDLLKPSIVASENSTQLALIPLREDSDDSVKDKDYVPLLSVNNSSSNKERDTIGIPKREKKRKTGTKRTSAKKMKINLEKYYIKPPCSNLCRKRCTFNFTDVDRLSIHAEYWAMDWESRGIYLKGLVDSDKCSKKTKKNTRNIRAVTNKYHFHKNDKKIEVCKTFFLCTLGYDKKNDRHVLTAIGKEISDQKDKRDGRNLKIMKVNRDLLTEHVNSFNPCRHHYGRAPNKKYLPSDLTIKMMHEDFIKLHPEANCCFETYRNHVSNVMNISFSQLGHEECETCELFDIHNADHVKERRDPDCETCYSYAKHKEKYTKARKHYDLDAKRVPKEEDVYVSANLQKVIMLPRLHSLKTTIFCPRIVVYHETFAPLRKCTSTNPVYAVIWHEAISGRRQEDLVSAFRAFLLSQRDAATVTIWQNNCSSQNKNWCLITFLISLVNSKDIAASKIVLKYFDPGHTFVSADLFHSNVEQSLLKKKKVYDFQDFSRAVESATSGKINVKQMEVLDFFIFKSHVAQQNLKDQIGNRVYLKDMVEIMVKRGKYYLYYKSDFDTEEYSRVNCLISEKIPKPENRTMPKGISFAKKKDIIEKLGPLIPENRMIFWRNIPTSLAENEGNETLDFDSDTE